MHRFYAERTDIPTDTAFLSPEDAHHALHVLRLGPGDVFEVMLDGRRFLASLVSGAETDGRTPVRLINELPSTEAKLRITLFQGLPKADKMDWIVQKATELGVARIVPVMMERCVSRPEKKDLSRKTDRWMKIAREACKQSGRCVVPEIVFPVRLADLPSIPYFPELCAVPWEEEHTAGPVAFVGKHASVSSLGIIIGPEGGITASEIALLRDSGCEPVTLGPRVLRTETAGIAACSAFLALYGEME